jgi:hypothetical protein
MRRLALCITNSILRHFHVYMWCMLWSLWHISKFLHKLFCEGRIARCVCTWIIDHICMYMPAGCIFTINIYIYIHTYNIYIYTYDHIILYSSNAFAITVQIRTKYIYIIIATGHIHPVGFSHGSRPMPFVAVRNGVALYSKGENHAEPCGPRRCWPITGRIIIHSA